MKRIAAAIISLFTLGILLTVNSCTPGACFDETESYLKASMYSYSTKKTLTPDSLSLFGADHAGHKIYDRASGVQPVLFPLDASADNCSFVITINGIADTIRFHYSSYPHLVSKECGFTFCHDLDSLYYTRHTIDSVSRRNNKITTANEENIRIYY